MKQANDNIFERPQKQRSFVGRLAVRTKSKIYNFQPYKTISKLFVKPDTRTWTRFDQGGSDLKPQDLETGFDPSLNGYDQDSNPREQYVSSCQRIQNSSPREKMNFSRIISPLHYHFGKSKNVPPHYGNVQIVTNVSSGVADKQCNEQINLVSFEEKGFSESTSSSPTVGCSVPCQSKRESKWKSCFDIFDFDEKRSAEGFWNNWRYGMNNYWQIFTGETTAHGYKRTMAPHRSKLGRFLWVLAIIGVTSSVMAILYTTMLGTDLYAFSSSIKSQPHVQMAFPAVTVCNLAPYDYSRIDHSPLKNYSYPVREFLLQSRKNLNLRRFGSTTYCLRQVNNVKYTYITKQEFTDSFVTEKARPIVSGVQHTLNDSNAFNVFKTFNTKDLQELIGWKLETFIQKCYWNEIEVLCSEIFVQSKTLTETCFTFNFDPNNPRFADRVGSVSGLSLLLDAGDGKEALKMRVASGLKVLLHEPMEFPNARENGLLISPGTTTYMSVAKMEYKFLPRPYKAYGSEYCSDSTSQVEGEVDKKMLSYYNYTGYSSCVADCRLGAIVEKCGCVVYAKDPDITGVPYCTMDKYITCYIPTLRDTYMTSPFDIPNCACPLPCQKVEYNAQMSSASFPRTVEGVIFLDKNSLPNSIESDRDIMQNYVELKIFYKELFTHIEEHVPLYTWLTIFGNVGGQLGLFTGASVLTFVEFLELFLVIIWLLAQATYVYFRTKWRSESRDLSSTWKSETGMP